jgi:hypothetical protein
VGRQIIRIEGKSGDGGPAEPAELADRSEALSHCELRDPSSAQAPWGSDGGVSTSATAAPFALERANELPREVLRAVLTYLISQVPDDLAAQAEVIGELVSAAASQLLELRAFVSGMERAGNEDELLRAAGIEGEQSAFFEAGLRRAREALAKALASAADAADDRMSKVRGVAATLLRGILSEVEEIERGVLRATKERLKDEGPRMGGSGNGGGGALKQHDAQRMSFQSADKDGKPRMIETSGGSSLEIGGGGKILSPDGFKIEAGGCSIEMAGGVVTITGDQVILKGAPIRLN